VGGVLENVKRWRDQVGLKPVSDAELARELQQLTVDGTPSTYVDLLGPESAGSKRHMLAVMVPRSSHTWFIKMVGPAELVSKQKPAFEAFAKSVRFEGDPGARP
jgi:hypothetical protein